MQCVGSNGSPNAASARSYQKGELQKKFTQQYAIGLLLSHGSKEFL